AGLLAGALAHLAAGLEAAAGAGAVGVDGAGALAADAADERDAAHLADAVVGPRAQLQLPEDGHDRPPQAAHPRALLGGELDVAGGAEIVDAARPAGLAVVDRRRHRAPFAKERSGPHTGGSPISRSRFASHHAATGNRCASSASRPTSWMPSGNPSPSRAV